MKRSRFSVFGFRFWFSVFWLKSLTRHIKTIDLYLLFVFIFYTINPAALQINDDETHFGAGCRLRQLQWVHWLRLFHLWHFHFPVQIRRIEWTNVDGIFKFIIKSPNRIPMQMSQWYGVWLNKMNYDVKAKMNNHFNLLREFPAMKCRRTC